jgi:prophage antirepressor-like protein
MNDDDSLPISEEAFEAIMASDTPSAKRFRRWLFEEVLPEIRRTGRYHGSPDRKRAMLATVGILLPPDDPEPPQ